MILFTLILLIGLVNGEMTWNAGGLAPNSLCFLKNNSKTNMGCISGNMADLIGGYKYSKSKEEKYQHDYGGYGYGYGYGFESASSYLSVDSTFSQNFYAYLAKFLPNYRTITTIADINIAETIKENHKPWTILRKGGVFLVVYDSFGNESQVNDDYDELITLAREFDMLDPSCELNLPTSESSLNDLATTMCTEPTTTTTTTTTTLDTTTTTTTTHLNLNDAIQFKLGLITLMVSIITYFII